MAGQKQLREELGYSTASPEVATRGRGRHAGKRMGSRVWGSRFSPPQLQHRAGAEFVTLGCIKEGTMSLLTGG